MNLADFLDRQINVISRHHEDSDDIPDYKYYECRIGCDICKAGPALGLKLNYKDLRNEKSYFLLNDIKIRPKKWYNKFSWEMMYKCSTKSNYPRLRDLHDQFPLPAQVRYNSDDECFRESTSGLTSCFESEYKEHYTPNEDIPYITICHKCFNWLRICEDPAGTIDVSSFEQIHPLKIFWADVLQEIEHDLIFKDADRVYLIDEFDLVVVRHFPSWCGSFTLNIPDTPVIE